MFRQTLRPVIEWQELRKSCAIHLRDLSSASSPVRDYRDLPSQTLGNTKIPVLPGLVCASPFYKSSNLFRLKQEYSGSDLRGRGTEVESELPAFAHRITWDFSLNGVFFSFPVVSAHPIEKFAEGHEGVWVWVVFLILRFRLPGLLINSWSSLLGWHQHVLKERGAVSEIQRAKIFGDLVSLRCLLQIAFPELREIISVTLVAVESSPAFFHWCRYVSEMGNHVSSNCSYM